MPSLRSFSLIRPILVMTRLSTRTAVAAQIRHRVPEYKSRLSKTEGNHLHPVVTQLLHVHYLQHAFNHAPGGVRTLLDEIFLMILKLTVEEDTATFSQLLPAHCTLTFGRLSELVLHVRGLESYTHNVSCFFAFAQKCDV